VKKILIMLSLVFILYPFSIKAIGNDEETLFSYYNKAASCAVEFNYQQRHAMIANLIDGGTNSSNLIANLRPAVSAWVNISIILEKILIKHYSWTTETLTDYRQDQFNRINIVAGRDFINKSPEDYLTILFNVTSNCPKLAIEIQEYVLKFDSDIPPNKDVPTDKPKRKM
jgi:hypothetical protein